MNPTRWKSIIIDGQHSVTAPADCPPKSELRAPPTCLESYGYILCRRRIGSYASPFSLIDLGRRPHYRQQSVRVVQEDKEGRTPHGRSLGKQCWCVPRVKKLSIDISGGQDGLLTRVGSWPRSVVTPACSLAEIPRRLR